MTGYCATHHRSPKTLSAYRTDLQQFAMVTGSDRALLQVDASHIEAWAATLVSNGQNPATIRRKLSSLRTFFAYWTRRGAIARSPFDQVAIELVTWRRLPKYLTAKELGALLRYVRRNASERDRAIVEVFVATAIRLGELIALNTSDIDLVETRLRIRGKGRRERQAFIVDPKGLSALRSQVKSRVRSTNEALFVNQRGKRLSPQGVANIVEGMASAAGLNRHVTPHMLRHTSATLLLRRGADLRIVQEMLGHASITMTQMYTHVANEHLREALERYQFRL